MSERVYDVLLSETDGKVRSLPSVTTLTRMIHSYALERYKLRLVAEIARTCPIDWSPDRILTAALDEGGAAAKAGTRQHELADLIHGAEPTPVTTAERAMMEVIARFFGAWKLEVLARETAVASLAEGWAGRLDRVVRLGMDVPAGAETIPAGTVCILDIKSGKAVQGEVALQLLAYGLADTLLVRDGGAFLPEPLPEWWTQMSPRWGLVAHLRLDGTAKLVPVRLDHGGAGRSPLDLMRMCRQAWEWDRYERDHLLCPPLDLPMTADEVAVAFDAVEVRDELDHYHAELWAWLEHVTREAAQHTADALAHVAQRWPVGCPSFKAVRKGEAGLPTLAQMRLVEETISEAMTRHRCPFPGRERPLPPRGASLAEVPESVIAIDSAHPLDVEQFRLEWESIHKALHPKRRIPSLPSIATRKTLAHYRAELAAYQAASA